MSLLNKKTVDDINEIKNKKNVPYILNNPGSFSNISSGSRYNKNKEDWNARS